MIVTFLAASAWGTPHVVSKYFKMYALLPCLFQSNYNLQRESSVLTPRRKSSPYFVSPALPARPLRSTKRVHWFTQRFMMVALIAMA